jgi:fucose permease
MLSTLPFLALFAVLAVLSVAIMILAFPGNQPQQPSTQANTREQGVAARGWFQEAQKDMRR